MYNRAIATSSILAGFTACIHLILGTPEAIGAIFQSNMIESQKLLLYACWHLVTATLFMSSYILFKIAKINNDIASLHVVKSISVLWIAFGLIFIAISLVHSGPGMMLELPQWLLLIPTGVVGLFGARMANAPQRKS